VSFTVANYGDADAQSFAILVQADPGLAMATTITVDGLAAGASQNLSATVGPGGNCYDSDCTTQVTVDAQNTVPESDERNNVDQQTRIG
jgi:hypothetical protein